MSEHPLPPETRRPEGPRFSLGKVVTTLGANRALTQAGESWVLYLARHVSGDWGDVSAEDAQANEDALVEGGRILSSYTLSTEERLWVLTEADRSYTSLLVPEEY